LRIKLSETQIPLYYQLETSLRDRLLSGELVEGDLFPSEQAIGKQYGVSRMTVRQALSSMVTDGLISRHPGRGTFVTKKEPGKAVHKSEGALEDAIFKGFGYVYDTKVNQFATVRLRKSIAEKLKVDQGTEALKIERVRLFEGEPIAFISNFLPMDIGQRLTIEDVQQRPVLKTLEERLGINMDKADQIIEAILADTLVAKHLHVRVGSAILQMTRITYDKNGRPVNYALVLFRADKYAFQVRLKRRGGRKHEDWIYI
jgi:GntR family transcriptional regulator